MQRPVRKIIPGATTALLLLLVVLFLTEVVGRASALTVINRLFVIASGLWITVNLWRWAIERPDEAQSHRDERDPETDGSSK